MLHLVVSEHLLHEQQRIRSDVDRRRAWARAHSSAASRPRYSATLLVATPIDSLNSSISVPSGSSMRTPKSGGPGIAAGAAVDVGDDLGGLWFVSKLNRCRPAAARSGHDAGCGRAAGAAAGLRNEVQDAVAAVALHDLFVAAHGVEDLRTQPDVADRADAVARFRDRDAVAACATPDRRCARTLRIHGADERGAFARSCSSIGLELERFRAASAFCSASTVFCSVGERGFGLLHAQPSSRRPPPSARGSCLRAS